MATATTNQVWQPSFTFWILLALAGATIGYLFRDAIQYMLRLWEQPEYNYGYLIPPIAIFLIWQKRDLLRQEPLQGSWLGLAVLCVGIGLFAIGQLGAVFTVAQYGLVLVIAGLALAYQGMKGFRHIWMAIVILLFMVPLPGFLQQTLSNSLQLISSRIGVEVIRLFGISVYLEGNVIDLGSLKLQVVEACSGLRYLFPLMTLGFIAAYFYSAPFWKRVVVFLSTIPITVLMNSFRIGMIGVLVEFWGPSQAEGFLHDFEGWVIFMACTTVLVIEMWLLSRLGGDRRPFREIFGIEMPPPPPKGAVVHRQKMSAPFLTGIVVILLVAVVTTMLPKRVDVIPERDLFAGFPTTLGPWTGNKERMEQIYIDALNFDDYIMADYRRSGDKIPVSLYVGYYETQRADKVPHSPRACLPGGGWAISDFGQRTVDGVGPAGGLFTVNRAIIGKDNNRQLVYYWFKQRSREVTHEYLVKWYILLDSVFQKRSDGALIRLVTPVPVGEDVSQADRRLSDFLATIAPELPRYVPD